jgi:hypothetical protein
VEKRKPYSGSNFSTVENGQFLSARVALHQALHAMLRVCSALKAGLPTIHLSLTSTNNRARVNG